LPLLKCPQINHPCEAEPRVNVRPKFQWSLPESRVLFECQYDYIDTAYDGEEPPTKRGPNQTDTGNPDESGHFGLKVKWLKDSRGLIVDKKSFALATRDSNQARQGEGSFGLADEDSLYAETDDDAAVQFREGPPLSSASSRASLTMASSRLSLKRLQINDTGIYGCCVELGSAAIWSQVEAAKLVGQDEAKLLVRDEPIGGGSTEPAPTPSSKTHLWVFHDNGISVYRLQADDSQEMELAREINGHSLVSGEVDGNWNQLTLCGGLNPEQLVICEWSDNALHLDVGPVASPKSKRYIYVGQPNLNRVIVMDGLEFEIVAIINTEPQPRKLLAYKPNKVHLSKWVRRRLSPRANAGWLSAIGSKAYPLKATPESQLYSMKPERSGGHGERIEPSEDNNSNNNSSSSSSSTATTNDNKSTTWQRLQSRQTRLASQPDQVPSKLIQHDIWLLCYGQPLVVNPAGDEEPLEEFTSAAFYGARFAKGQAGNASRSTTNSTVADHPDQFGPTVQPFAPRLPARQPFSWSIWPPNKESRLRNRKSVHIIQSTFFPKLLADPTLAHVHGEESGQTEFSPQSSAFKVGNSSTVADFKRSSVLTTHHVFSGLPAGQRLPRYLSRHRAQQQFDLIQELYVPPRPYSLEANSGHKMHSAFVTHYDDTRLFRVSMDEYRYEREIDLQSCDPINLITTAQGLLVVQCRAPITHNLIGQLVLDQLTSARIEFNANICAQASYLSPDHRFLISVFTSPAPEHERQTETNLASEQRTGGKRRQSIVYVQKVATGGLKLQYEIKTSLELVHCSFVWKDGYYAAIFVSVNRKEQQSEILSLRIADSRLELMARVPGLVSQTRHKEQMVVSPELQMAALSTSQGTFVVDLEDNRVSQSLRRHQSAPTLLWVQG